jgi:hypothetical protein
MLKPLEVSKAPAGWLNVYAADFTQRFASLLSFNFRVRVVRGCLPWRLTGSAHASTLNVETASCAGSQRSCCCPGPGRLDFDTRRDARSSVPV